MTQAPVLAHYCSEKGTIISADASSYGLGAVLLQVQEDDTKKPIAYASRSMTSTEQRYAQIEKEALATTWACEKFSDFVLGKEFLIETDHKPLVPLLGSKCLQDMPPRIQRFRMRLMRYSYQIVHVPGKDLTTADTLSKAPLHRSLTKDERRQSHNSLSVKARCIRQDTHRSSRHPEMPRKGEKWCLVADSQQADRRSCQRMPYLHQDEN